MLLTYVTSQDVVRQMPIRSTEKFLRWLLKKMDASQFSEEIGLLQNSLDFRNKFVDHPQQHALHDWMTMTHPSGAGAIIYYIKNGTEVYYRGSLDPFHPDFKPPVNYKSFYVSPDYIKIHNLIKLFVITSLNTLNKNL